MAHQSCKGAGVPAITALCNGLFDNLDDKYFYAEVTDFRYPNKSCEVNCEQEIFLDQYKGLSCFRDNVLSNPY